MAQPKVVRKGEGTVLKPPAQCLITKRGDLPLVDFGVDYIGVDPHLYLAVGQVERAASDALGMVNGDQHASLREEFDDLLLENKELAAKLKAKPLIQEAIAEGALRELVFTAAGAATAPLLEDNPDYDFAQATERITERVELVLQEFLNPEEEDKT